MAELPGLEEFLLGGYDVTALLAGAPAAQAPGQPLLGLEAQLQLKAATLPQQALGWPHAGPTDQNDIYQKVAQSLAAKLEEHRLQQVQVATALQHLQALQQQQELAQLQQQLTALHQQHVVRPVNSFQRSRTTDLESLGRGSTYDVAGAYAPTIDFEQQKQLVALQQATANPATPLVGLQRLPGVLSQHSLPVRSFSSEHLVSGQRRPPAQMLGPNNANGGQLMQGLPNNKRAPIRQPSGLGPNGRNGPNGANNGNGRNGDNGPNGRRARYAATAKAPSWASEDWHPMKAVIASGAHASGGTGVFLPHLATASASASSSASAAAAGNGPSLSNSGVGLNYGITTTHSSSASSSGHAGAASSIRSGGSGRSSSDLLRPHPHQLSPQATLLAAVPQGLPSSGMHTFVTAAAAAARPVLLPGGSTCSPGSSSHSPVGANGGGDGSPSCSVESNAICSVGGVDPYSRQTTFDQLSRGSTHSEPDSHPTTTFGYMVDPMKVVVEEPEREREDVGPPEEECDFVSLARELAELMSKQVIAE